jgi:hypothetical protein
VAVAELYDTGQYERVYSLAIRSFHTYFVCDQSWPCSVWADNQYHAPTSSGRRIDPASIPGHARRAKNYDLYKVLPDQNVIRYYTKFKPAQKAGRVAGARIVTEVNVSNGAVRRVWQELYDHAGNVIEVHPQFPIDLGHIPRIP